MDKLEQGLAPTPQRDLLAEQLGGKTTTQLICLHCRHVKAREEKFFVLSLEVKGQRQIADSLRLFVEGETLDGDNQVSPPAAAGPLLRALVSASCRPPPRHARWALCQTPRETFRSVAVGSSRPCPNTPPRDRCCANNASASGTP